MLRANGGKTEMTIAPIANDVRLLRADDVVATDMDGETVMMDVQKGSYFALSGSGTRIWELLEQPRSINDVIAALSEEFDTAGAEDVEGVVTDFVAKLLDKGLVRPAD